jgi:hypothetical protein
MAAKELKAEIELASIIMNAIRIYPELDYISGVIVRRMDRHGPTSANWDATFEIASGKAPSPIPQPLAYKVVEAVQLVFDLA